MELIVVIILVGLITATAVTKLGGALQRARTRQAVARLAAADATLRTWAWMHATAGQLQFDFDSGSVQRTFGRTVRMPPTQLAHGIRVARFVSATRDRTAGRLAVRYAPDGTTETFAVQLTSPARAPVWLLFAGVTGQMTPLEDARHAETTLHAIRRTRLDSH